MALAPLATIDDVTNVLGRELTDAEAARVPTLLLNASAKVRSFTSQQISQSTSVARVRITARDGHIRLPQYPVTAVASVTTVQSGIGLPFYWDGLVLWGWGRYPQSNIELPLYNRAWRHGVVVDVAYTHGYETVPDEIVAVVVQMAARALGTAPDESGITQETYSGYSYTLGAAAAAGPLGLLPAEKEVLADYAPTPVQPISML